jgi:hypothetical protein
MYVTHLALRLALQHSTRSSIRDGSIYSITDNLNYLRTRAEHRITRWTVARPPVVYYQSKALRYLSSQDWMLFIQGEVIYYLGHCFPASSQTKAVPASPISRTDQS